MRSHVLFSLFSGVVLLAEGSPVCRPPGYSKHSSKVSTTLATSTKAPVSTTPLPTTTRPATTTTTASVIAPTSTSSVSKTTVTTVTKATTTTSATTVTTVTTVTTAKTTTSPAITTTTTTTTASKTSTSPPASTTSGGGKYPFSQVVAFGDELSDNGNGSYAHGITGDPALVYGYGTWTNGPVAVSYLSDMIHQPLVDYAFGGCCGGGKIGATIDSSYTVSDAGAPCVSQQITNFTSGGALDAANSMGFIWAGQNDLSKHTDAFWLEDSANTNFISQFTSITVRNAQSLIDQGMKTIFVANIYPKQLAPVTKVYLCADNADCYTTWAKVIQNANSALKTALSALNKNGVKVIYYDSYSYISQLHNSAAANGFYMPLSNFCDGDPTDPNQVWDHCWNSKTFQLDADGIFWLNYVQPSSRVHQMVAADMKRTLDAAFA